MIHIDRSRVPAPEFLLKVQAEEVRRLREAYARVGETQTRVDFNDTVWTSARSALTELCLGKCAYCEQTTEVLDIEHFRPRQGARDLDGRAEQEYYYWLAYEWRNLLVACRQCNRNKASQFPVEGPRVSIDAPYEAVVSEAALLIDPCIDEPSDHLHFETDGQITALGVRGNATISILGLNRETLVRKRRDAWQLVDAALRALEMAIDRRNMPAVLQAREEFDRLTSPTAEFAGMRRQLGFRRGRQVLGIEFEPPRSRAQRESVPESVPVPVPDVVTTYMERIEITNFRALRQIAFDIPTGSDGKVGWKVLLGENGIGKSSILQAVALALIGQSGIQALNLQPMDVISPSAGAARVVVHLSTSDKPIVLDISSGGFRFASGGDGARTFIRAYGSTRLLPRPTDPVPSRYPIAAVANLLDPHVALASADRWLLSLNPERRHAAALALKDLGIIEQQDHLQITESQVVVKRDGALMPFKKLSDGYQTTIALVCDIMAGLPGTTKDFHSNTGIVLLDEIGTHLHPRWRMQIVRALRQAFPTIQFLATTHEPLCLRGLGDQEVAVLEHQDDEIVLNEEVPSPASLRVDQLLTSRIFGLHSTIDPQVDADFARYYALLARDDLTPEEIQELRQLRTMAAGHSVLGYTRRDQLIYEIIDQYLAKNPRAASAPVSEETRRRVLDVWERVNILRGARE